VSPEIEDLLARLGYVSAPMNPDAKSRPDPRKVVTALSFIYAADRLVADGRVGDGIEALEILATSPAVRGLALIRLGRIFSFAGESARAVAAHNALVKLTGSATARVALAQALVDDGQPDAALAVLGEIAGDSGNLRSVALGRARALLALDRADEAELAANQVLVRQPDHDGALALRSQARALRDGPAAEILRLEALLANPPAPVERLAVVRGTLANLLREQGRLEEARSWLEAGAPRPSQMRALAQIAAELGDLQRAIDLYEDLTGRFPAMLDARRELAEFYGRVGRVDDELTIYDELIDLDPLDATLLVDRGTVLYHAERREDALRDFRTAAIADAELPEAPFNLGLLYLENGRDDDAETQLLRAVELRPDYGKAHYHLARVYRRRGDPRAAKHAELAVQVNPAVSSGPPGAP
jgi:tetratricopeptide (TPR) repeat protein